MKKIFVMMGLAISIGCSESPYIDYSMLKDDVFETNPMNKAEQYADSLDENSKTGREITNDIFELYVSNNGPLGCKNRWFNPYTKRVECLPDDFWEAPGKFVRRRDVGETQGMGLKNGGRNE